MPASSVRDVIIKNDDLVAATHGRGFWILDDITPLRQLQSKVLAGDAFLFRPQDSYRVRWNMNSDTPLPPDEPATPNPPDGAIINYYLKSASTGPISLEIRDGADRVVRHYSSADPVEPADPMLAIPAYWPRPQQVLSNAAGMHRFLWDMHYTPTPGVKPSYPISAIAHNTAPDATSPWVMPGQYTVVLTANGQSYSQPLTIKMDPRVKTPSAELAQQFKLSEDLYADTRTVSSAMEQVKALRAEIKDREKNAPAEVATSLAALDQKLQTLGGGEGGRGGGGGGRGGDPKTFAASRAALLALMGMLQEADVAPTTAQTDAAANLKHAEQAVLDAWQSLKSQDIAAVNTQLRNAKMPELRLDVTSPGPGAQ
jgi:hypothetical protein